MKKNFRVIKKILVITLVLALALTCLVACGNGGEQPGGGQTPEGKTIYLTYSGTGSDKTFNEGLFEDFKAAMKAACNKVRYPNEDIVTMAIMMSEE